MMNRRHLFGLFTGALACMLPGKKVQAFRFLRRDDPHIQLLVIIDTAIKTGRAYEGPGPRCVLATIIPQSLYRELKESLKVDP